MAKATEKRNPTLGYAFIVIIGVLAIVLGGNKLLGAPIQPMFLIVWLWIVPMCMHLGYSFKEIEDGMMESIKKGMGAVLTVLAVGALVATWIAAGTVPTIIYIGLKIIRPNIFLLATFILCSLVSLACGTSWGTIGTAGIAMFAVGESLGIPMGMTIGAIVSGSYLGDMISPMSDSTNVVSATVGTDLVTHCKEIGILTIPVSIITGIIYFIMGIQFGGENFDATYISGVMTSIGQQFKIGPVCFIPLVLLLYLIIRKKPSMLSMIVSALVAGVVAVLYQGMDYHNVITVFWNGYKADTGEAFIDTLLNRGGITSMSALGLMMIFAFGMIGAFNTVGLMDTIIHPLAKKTKTTFQLTLTSEIIALIGNMMGSNTFSLLMTGALMLPAYEEKGLHPTNLSKAINATSTPGCTFIPWNASGLYIAGAFGITNTLIFAPYACLVYLMPVAVLISVVIGYRVIPASVNLEGGEKYRKNKEKNQ